jgi:hypothetical protein
MRTYFTAVLTLVLSVFAIGPTLAQSNVVESNVRITSPTSKPTGVATQAQEVFINKYGFDPYKLNTNSRLLINCSSKPVRVAVFNHNDMVRLAPFMTVKVEPGKASGYLNCKDVSKGCLIRVNGYPPVASVPSPVVTFDGEHQTYYTNSDAIMKGCSAFTGVSLSRAKNALAR